MTSGGSQSHSKGEGERWERGSILPSVDKERGTDSLPLDSGQSLSPTIQSQPDEKLNFKRVSGAEGNFSCSPPSIVGLTSNTDAPAASNASVEGTAEGELQHHSPT